LPGLLVVAPTAPEDAKGMLKSAIRGDNPVMFLESMSLYNVRGMVPAGDYTVPLGKAAVRRTGSDVTIVGVSRMAVLANEAAKQMEEEDIDAEVIDMRSIRPIDWQPIVDSVRKTSRCVVVEEGWSTYGVTAEVAAGVQERCFDYLDAPIRRLGGAQVPLPYNQQLERVSIPTSEDIKRLGRHTLGRKPDAQAGLRTCDARTAKWRDWLMPVIDMPKLSETLEQGTTVERQKESSDRVKAG